MPFDVAGARKAGYSDSEIADFLAPMKEFDTAAARKSGYDDSEIVDFLAKAPDPLKGGLINSMMRDTGPVKSGLPNNDVLNSIKGEAPSDAPEKPSDHWALTRGLVTKLMGDNPRATAETLEGFSFLVPNNTDRVDSETGMGAVTESMRKMQDKAPHIDEMLRDASKQVLELANKSPKDFALRAEEPSLKNFDLGKTLTWVGEGVGGAIGSSAASIVGALGGGAVAGPGGAAFGAAAPSYVLNYGDVYGQLKAAGVPKEQAAKWAFGAAIPITALDTINPTRWVGGLGTKEAKAEAVRGVVKRILAETGESGVIEAGTEGAQDLISSAAVSAASDKPFFTAETAKSAALSAIIGGLTGGIMGGGAKGITEALTPAAEAPADNSKVDAYIQHRDNQLSGGLGDFAPGKEPTAAPDTAAPPPPDAAAPPPPNTGTPLIDTTTAAPPADTITPQQKVSVDSVLAAPDVDTAIAAAAEAAVASPTGAPRASLDQMIDETKKSLDQDLPNLRSKRQAAVDQLYANNRDAIAEPLEAWEPDPAKPDAGAVTPEFANAAREHFAKYGVDVVFVKDIGEKGFDGVVDERQPNTVFISSNPTRAVAQISMHELGHTFEGVKLPDGSNLNQMLKQQLAEGLTSDARLALELHSETAPSRASFPSTPEGQAAHADAVLDHLYNELGKDMIGDAPRFTGFVEKVIGAVEERYGKNVATDVLGKLMTSLRESFNTLQKFFKPARMFETDKWVTNLDQIHDTIAKMHAAKIGETEGLSDKAPTAENVVTEAMVGKEANPTRAGPKPREGYAEAKQQAEVYKRWLGELDTKRRSDAEKSPQVAHLRAEEKAIVAKVRGGEKYLTKAARDRLAKIRAAIEDRVNPKTDNEDMAVVRAKMVEAHARMAKAAEVTKEKTEEPAAKKPASGEPVRIGKPTPREAETGNPTDADRFVANQMAQDTGGKPQFSPKVEEKGPVFFSALERAVDSVKFDKAPPGQWLATIKNMPGIKAEEIKTTGIDKWLGAQTRPVTKAEVLEQLEVGSVKIEEVMKGGVIGPAEEAEYDELRAQYRAQMEDMPQAAYDRMVELERIANSDNPTKFAEYSLPGGKDYHELLLTLPAIPRDTTGWTAKEAEGDPASGPIWEVRDANKRWILGVPRESARTAQDAIARAAKNSPIGSAAGNFKGKHWAESNVLAHIRFDTRTGPNGEKILHIAEIQSDWHQIGRKNGYGDASKVPALVEASKKATDEMYALREKKFAEATGGKYTSKREIYDDASPEAMEALSRVNAIDSDPEMLAAIKKHNDAVEALRKARSAVPDAPFKTTWHELAFKRALRYAVENGYDRVTWDTGDTNADRYDLSQKVEYIDWYKTATGKYHLDVYDHDGDVIYGKTIPAEEIPDVVGKDIADGIVQSKKSEGRVDGDGLKVGGSGMRGFYDKILPAFVDKYVKKWAAKVEDGVVPTAGTTLRDAAAQPEDVAQYHDMSDETWNNTSQAERRVLTQEYINDPENKAKNTGNTPVHSLDITPQMRAEVMRGQPKFSPKIKISKPGKDVADKNVHGFAPSLRVRVLNPPKFALNNKGEPQTLLTQTTTNGNAGKQLENLDDVLSKFKNPTKSPEAWSEMMAYALGGSDVPIPPYAFIRDLNSAEATNKVSALSAGQIEDATHGFEQAAKFRAAYESGQLTPVTTGKLFLWSFLSRGVSPYVQESLFIDAFDGAAPWIQRAADGNFTKDDMPEYEAWARSVAPKGSGQPGAGATHNLNAFGNNFLVNMALKDETGKTRMQHLHEMFSDPNMTGQQIRREFMKFGEGVGIDNKVVSFTLLVAGHSDVMVIDRVQTRQLWDDGRFKDTNIYDGQKDAEGKVITGTPLANLTYGVRGLLAYEAIERGLQAKIGSIYAAAGRPQDASVGRYHWESWVAYSQQEASHGTLGAILDDALISKSNRSAIADVTAKQGEYGAYEYGARYGRDDDNRPFFRYDTPSGGRYEFSVPAFRAFLEEIKKPANGVVPSKFKVTASGNEAWYERPEVNRARLDDVARRFADRNREGALPGPVPGEDFAGGPLGAGADAQPYAAAQFSPRLDTTRQLRSDRAGDAGSSRSYTRGGGRDGGRGRLLKSLGVTYAAEWNAGKDLRESYTAAGVNIPARVLELEQTDSNARRFADLITAAKSANRFGAAVAVYPVEDYKNFRLMLADNGKSGVAVKPDGDIVSVFSTDKSGSAMMEVAVAAGGVKLDAFDTILPKFYHRFGFVEAARTSWNDEYAPEGWDKDLYKKFNGGKPDVVLMVLDPKEMSAELQRAPVYPSWDEAAEAQERLLDYLHPAAPEGATINLRLDRLDGGQSFTVDEARAVVEDTGARVIAERARRIYGKSGAPAVAMQLDRPLTAEEANAVSERLKQDAISQFADGQGEVLGPNAAKWGPFDPSKFQTVESASFSPRVPSSLREKMIRQDPTYAAMFGNNAGPSSTTVVDLPPIPDRAPRRRAQQPIDGTGETRFRAINGEAYDVGEEKPQLDRAARLVAEDPERALAIAMLEAKSLTGVHPQFVFIELEKAAIANNDYALQERLSRSPISELATTQGQQTAAWRNRLKDTPAEAMRQIRLAREARGKARGIDPEAKINETVERGLRVSRATAKSTKKANWNDFIASLICKV